MVARLLFVTFALVPAGLVEASQRTVVRNATILTPAAGDADRLQRLDGHTVVIEAGLIVAVKPTSGEDLAAGDVLVDAAGRWVTPGYLDVRVDQPVRYSELARLPLEGVTALASPLTPAGRSWLLKIAAGAAMPLPSLVPAADPRAASAPKSLADGASPEEVAAYIVARTRRCAAALGLTDRGAVATGCHGDLLLFDVDPLTHPGALWRPLEAVVEGVPLRLAAMATHRAMIEDADKALAALPTPGEGARTFEVESQGLRVGRLDCDMPALNVREWWGPPIDQETRWSLQPAADRPGEWRLVLHQSVRYGMDVEMTMERGAASIRATAQVVRPEKLPEVSTDLDAAPRWPLLDPITLATWERKALAAMEVGDRRDVEVVEPVPAPGKVRVGVRVLRFVRWKAEESPLPLRSGERLFALQSLPPVGPSQGRAEGPTEPKEPEAIGWVITDHDGAPARASLLAPEGVTEYFLSLLQPPPSPRPQSEAR